MLFLNYNNNRRSLIRCYMHLASYITENYHRYFDHFTVQPTASVHAASHQSGDVDACVSPSSCVATQPQPARFQKGRGITNQAADGDGVMGTP